MTTDSEKGIAAVRDLVRAYGCHLDDVTDDEIARRSERFLSAVRVAFGVSCADVIRAVEMLSGYPCFDSRRDE